MGESRLIPLDILNALEELCGEAEMDAFKNGKIKADRMYPSNPDLAQLASNVYRAVHWYAAPDCRRNHPSWEPGLPQRLSKTVSKDKRSQNATEGEL